MQIFLNPTPSEWKKLTSRPAIQKENLDELVKEIFERINKSGDSAVKEYCRLYDNVEFASLNVPENKISESENNVSNELKAALEVAIKNIKTFHNSQVETNKYVETSVGVKCWRENRAIEKVGIYIPGGTAPLFSTVLMLGIPAMIAGCKEIILCTPPNKNGEINPVILYTAKKIGIKSVHPVGGIQAIAAMTYGTETIQRVNKIFGPGNQYVTAAKTYAQSLGVAIDMPAGPSEVLIIADSSCVPKFVAADLLSQAEHGEDSQVILLSDTIDTIKSVIEEIEKQIKELPRATIAKQALNNSFSICFKTIDECIEFSNEYAPEHLILAVNEAKSLIPRIVNAGSVFIGNYSCESAGDYASGTNHTLPTNGFAKSYSGVSLDSFVKKISFQEITKTGLENIGPAIELMAEAEQLIAHKNAVNIRLKS